jgi:hypothetical protein
MLPFKQFTFFKRVVPLWTKSFIKICSDNEEKPGRGNQSELTQPNTYPVGTIKISKLIGNYGVFQPLKSFAVIRNQWLIFITKILLVLNLMKIL